MAMFRYCCRARIVGVEGDLGAVELENSVLILFVEEGEE